MKFALNIDSSNQALTDESAADALADIVADVAAKIRDGYTSGYTRDYNGNGVGFWEYTPELITESDEDE